VQDTLSQAAAALTRGQTLEAQGNPTALAAAVRCYDEALTLLRTLPTGDETVRRELARAAMNRGNALQRQSVPALLPEAVRAYEEAISRFRSLPIDRNPDDRNSLGAAWMNRGHALYLQATAASLAEAARSQTEAIETLRPLPLDEARSYRLNLSASWLNLANALLALGEAGRGLRAGREAAALAAPGEDSDPALADIGLKARRAACEAISRELIGAIDTRQPTDALADEASDLVDEGLATARKWESRGLPIFRPIAARLFRFGTQLYGAYLPNFLAEFVLEHLDPARSAGAMAMVEDGYEAAGAAIARARADLEGRRTIFLDTPETTRLLQRLRDLREAEARLGELRREHLGGK
jgi:hypothetical protein